MYTESRVPFPDINGMQFGFNRNILFPFFAQRKHDDTDRSNLNNCICRLQCAHKAIATRSTCPSFGGVVLETFSLPEMK